MTRNLDRGKSYLAMESDYDYRARLLESGRLSGLERGMAESYQGAYLDGLGDSLKPPLQRKLMREEA